MLCEPPRRSPMDGLVEELLRLESAKHKALVEIDAPAYDANVRAQLRLVSASIRISDKLANVDRLLALSQLITLNSRLLQNLVSTTPWFALGSNNGYNAKGRVSDVTTSRRISVEA